MFYGGNTICVRVRMRMNLITNALAPERVPILYFRNKTHTYVLFRF